MVSGALALAGSALCAGRELTGSPRTTPCFLPDAVGPRSFDLSCRLLARRGPLVAPAIFLSRFILGRHLALAARK